MKRPLRNALCFITMSAGMYCQGDLVLARSVHPNLSKDSPPVALTTHADGAFGLDQANFAIEGKVSDNTGSPLPGVNILVKGTASGTTSDSDGNFKLNVADGNAVLVFSFIGYITQEVGVANR